MDLTERDFEVDATQNLEIPETSVEIPDGEGGAFHVDSFWSTVASRVTKTSPSTTVVR